MFVNSEPYVAVDKTGVGCQNYKYPITQYSSKFLCETARGMMMLTLEVQAEIPVATET